MRRVLIAGLLSLLWVPSVVGQPKGKATFDAPTWKSLRFEASKLFMTATTEIHLTEATPDIENQLLPSPHGRAVPLPKHSLWSLQLSSSAVGRVSHNRVWFDPATWTAIQRSKEKVGSKPYDKTSRFTLDGVYTRRRSPSEDAQRDKPAEDWGKVGNKFEPYPGWQHGAEGKAETPSSVLGKGSAPGKCRTVLEPSQLLYLLGVLNTASLPEDLCLFAKGNLSRLSFEKRQRTTIEVDFEESGLKGNRRRQEKVNARCLVIRSLTLDGQASDELELLGLEGDVEIYLDESRGLPLEIHGKLPSLGSVRVRLVGVTLR